MSGFTFTDNDHDDPVVWQRGKLLASGMFRIVFMRQSDKERLLKVFGKAWLDAHLAEAEAAVQSLGEH